MKSYMTILMNIKKNKRYRCRYCGKEITNLDKGCTDCKNNKDYDLINFDERIESMIKEKNTIATILKIISWIILIAGFISGILLGQSEYVKAEIDLVLQLWLICGGTFLGVYSLSEIIQILHDIRFKVWKK